MRSESFESKTLRSESFHRSKFSTATGVTQQEEQETSKSKDAQFATVELPKCHRVVPSPSQISKLEGKRGQYQDYGFARTKRQRNVDSKLDICGTSEKRHAETADL